MALGVKSYLKDQTPGNKKVLSCSKAYWDQKGIWGKGYFVSTIGINEEVIRKYVQYQAVPG